MGKARTRGAFHEYSSYNRKDGRRHPLVTRRMNRVLDMWAEMATLDDIAAALDIHVDTAKHYIRRAKRLGDPRAVRPTGWDKRRMKAALRRQNIKLLADANMDPREIAKRLDVHVRLVQMRLKEASDA